MNLPIFAAGRYSPSSEDLERILIAKKFRKIPKNIKKKYPVHLPGLYILPSAQMCTKLGSENRGSGKDWIETQSRKYFYDPSYFI